jgi:ribosomal protein L18E
MIAERLQADSVVVVEGSVGGAEDEDLQVVVASRAVCYR